MVLDLCLAPPPHGPRKRYLLYKLLKYVPAFLDMLWFEIFVFVGMFALSLCFDPDCYQDPVHDTMILTMTP